MTRAITSLIIPAELCLGCQETIEDSGFRAAVGVAMGQR